MRDGWVGLCIKHRVLCTVTHTVVTQQNISFLFIYLYFGMLIVGYRKSYYLLKMIKKIDCRYFQILKEVYEASEKKRNDAEIIINDCQLLLTPW